MHPTQIRDFKMGLFDFFKEKRERKAKELKELKAKAEAEARLRELEAERFRELVAKAEAGDKHAQCKLGEYYCNAGTPKDFAKGVEWHRKAAAQGLFASQNVLNLYARKGMI